MYKILILFMKQIWVDALAMASLVHSKSEFRLLFQKIAKKDKPNFK